MAPEIISLCCGTRKQFPQFHSIFVIFFSPFIFHFHIFHQPLFLSLYFCFPFFLFTFTFISYNSPCVTCLSPSLATPQLAHFLRWLCYEEIIQITVQPTVMCCGNRLSVRDTFHSGVLLSRFGQYN